MIYSSLPVQEVCALFLLAGEVSKTVHAQPQRYIMVELECQTFQVVSFL
jgi:hypothetical protein